MRWGKKHTPVELALPVLDAAANRAVAEATSSLRSEARAMRVLVAELRALAAEMQASIDKGSRDD